MNTPCKRCKSTETELVTLYGGKNLDDDGYITSIDCVEIEVCADCREFIREIRQFRAS